MKQVFITMVLCAFVTIGMAQNRNEKIEAFKIGIFTQQMELTPAESQVFWPLYNEYEAKKEALKMQYNKKGQFRNLDGLSDKETEQLILKHFEGEEAELDLRRIYFEKFKAILPITKVAKIYKSEFIFKQKLVQEMRKRRGAEKRKN